MRDRQEARRFRFYAQDGNLVRDPRKAWYDLCVRSQLGRLIPVEEKKCKFKRCIGLDLHDFRRRVVRSAIGAGVPERGLCEHGRLKTRNMLDRYHIVNETGLVRSSELMEAGRQASLLYTETDTKTDTSVRRAS